MYGKWDSGGPQATTPAVVTVAATTPTENEARGKVRVNRNGWRSTTTSGDVATVDMVGSFPSGGARHTAHHVHE